MHNMPSIVQVSLKKTLSRCLSKKNYNKLLYRTYFTHFSKSKNQNGYGRENTDPRLPNRINTNIAILTSGSLLLAYHYFSTNNVLALDSIKGLRQYSSGMNDNENSSTENNKNSVMLLTDEEVNKKLHDLEESLFVNQGKGIVRYDISQLPSNNPIEDNHIEQILTVPRYDIVEGNVSNLEASVDAAQSNLYFFGIFDGHSGPFTSAKLTKDLVRYVATQLNELFSVTENTDTEQYSAQFDDAIEKGFLQLDSDIVYESLKRLLDKPTKENMISSLPAISGSCALLSVYDSKNSIMKVAVTGDSRALICEQLPSGEYTVKALSTDQTGDNLAEVERIKNEHPDEPHCIKNGRVLGSLQPSRAFGDYRYKVKDIDGKSLNELPDHVKLYFRKEPRNFLTPPYVTARPEITTTKIDLQKAKFMVMGSDGLFELLTNEEIAGLVIRWMERQPVANDITKKSKLLNKKINFKLPLVNDLSTDKDAQRPAFRYKNGNNTKGKNTPEYILEDLNVSTHLIRNALSAGGSKEYVSTLVSIPSPISRKYRDDLTVTVVFFGNSEDSTVNTSQIKNDGQIVTNIDATTPPKPRL
ncbi:hypothetical protein TPHA_0P00960 [Tetrapisispora phaffii CBS 4417]|uniref:PPM-type phosphatase domain-containing protein n=1 Tax=Tetrapisispora phaffii (strain ATCC 24235 / CBS 4417 / NBRC 1672 / NRRL Y-8282 / UCD 70-5) TaxID=1071381 RepID=G8C276_TETPH|nr:hypothetical protein TPHA_0P00960 [Tetrapisispora phaffii CBS 4417]CCE66254.1 hypothetical protein TPHA_0P00960 [Tetrapisispora phaffii CBS 4417]